MAQYMILIYDDEATWAKSDQEAFNQVMKGHQVFGETNAKALRGGEALEPTGTATSIRPDASGGFTVTDGPFVETKEALGGFYIVEAADLDAAIGMAKQIPVLAGGFEVRPVKVFE